MPGNVIVVTLAAFTSRAICVAFDKREIRVIAIDHAELEIVRSVSHRSSSFANPVPSAHDQVKLDHGPTALSGDTPDELVYGERIVCSEIHPRHATEKDRQLRN